MEKSTTTFTGPSATSGKYRRRWALLTLFLLFFAGGVFAQGGSCDSIHYSFEQYEPCKFRARYQNSSDCYIEIRYILASGEFSSWSVNAAAGFTVDVISPTELWVHHNGGFMPLGNQVPLLFTLPYDLNTTMNIAWLDNCQQVGCELAGGLPIESCPDPMDASIIGVKYRECGSLPYSNQPTLPDWTIQLLNADGNIEREQATDANGEYAFFDLPHKPYIVRELLQPGWTPKVPATGEYSVNLTNMQQAVLNFGNCPSCSCDSIQLTLQPISNNTNNCCYRVVVQNQDASCFKDIAVEVGPGLSIPSWSLTAPGWSVTPITPSIIRADPPGGFVPVGTVLPITFCVAGGAAHTISVSTHYNNGQMSVLCETLDTFNCPGGCPDPDNYVQNGNFEQGTPPGPDESIGFAAFWSAIWTGCTSTADFYNTIFPPPFALPSPMPASQGNFGGMWAKPHGSNLVWREGMMNQIVPIAANSGTYNMTAKFACLTPVQPTPNTPLPVIEVWGVPAGPPVFGTCPGLTGPNSSIFPNAVLLGTFTPSANCDKNFQTFNNFTFSAPNFLMDRIFLTRQQPAAGQPGSDVYVAVDDICLTKVSNNCICRQNDVTYSTAGTNITIPCQQGPNFPVFFCPTGPVTISGDFGCVDASGNPCPAPPYPPIDWILYGPNGIIQQGAIITGSPWSLPFTAADLHGSGFFTLYMTTLCPGQMDSCKCVATWFQECPPDSCVCGPNPWDLEFRYGGGQNQPVQCGQTLNVTTGSAFYPKFNCQGPPNCGRVDWVLTDPAGNTVQSMVGVVPGPGGVFVIPPLQPTNFPSPGTYTLQMTGICGTDTCPCTVYFCLPPQPPNVNDADICRTLSSVYIPLQGCPTDCDIAEVQWFVKPCSASNWPPLPYQISSAGNPQDCDDLLFLPYQYPNEACVQVYAVIKLDPGCCVPDLTSNIATITLCNPIACSITNPNTLGFCQSGQPLPLTGVLTGANCNYTVEWYDDAGQLVSNSLIYTPPVLTFPSTSTACYKDFTFTLKVTGICGTSFCSTTIRVFNNNADNGDLVMDPLEPQPFCPGEDARLTYLDKCSGPPPKWQWYSSTVSGNSGYNPILGTGMMNPTYYTNQLYQTTWYMVESQNGVCPPQQDKLKIEVKDAISIVDFDAIPDPCVDSYVTLTVDFTPSPVTGPNCQYVVDWYYNGNLIHTSTSLTSPVSYTYPSPTPGMGSMAGVYYAVVRDNCCPGSAQTWPEILNPTCVPGIEGPCYVCDKTTQYTLTGGMVLPPQDPCPPGVSCTYQWYQLDIATGNWLPVGTPNSLTYTTMCGGHFRFESICDYGYGPCIRNAYHDVAQCTTGVNGCVYVDAPEITLPIGMKVDIHPNPTSGNVTVQISPAALQKGRLEVVDVNGKVLAAEMLPDNQASHTLSLAQLPNGIYFARVFESEMLVWVGKIVRSE